MHVNASIHVVPFLALERVHELVACLHPPCPLRQQQQQIELPAGQFAPLAAHPDLARRAIDFQWPHAQPVGRLGLARARPTQHRGQARQQFPRVERLGQVVICADFNSHDAVHIIAPCREHHDGDLGKGAQTATHLQPIDPRQHHIKNHGVVPVAALGLQPAFPVSAAIHDVPVPPQVPAQHLDQAGIVIDQKNADWHDRNRRPGNDIKRYLAW